MIPKKSSPARSQKINNFNRARDKGFGKIIRILGIIDNQGIGNRNVQFSKKKKKN